MAEEEECASFRDICCCCSACCFPEKTKQEEMTIEAYQPVVPEAKKFGYPQLEDEVRPLRLRETASDDERLITAQPRPIDKLVPTAIPRSRSIDASIKKKRKESLTHRSSSSIVAGMKHAPAPLKPFSAAKVDPLVSITSPKTPTPKRLPLSSGHATLQFNIYYNTHRASFNVHIHQGLSFPQKRSSSKGINSFIKAILLPSRKQTLKTRVFTNSRNPSFDQILEFSGLSLEELNGQTLVLQLFYHTTFGEKYVSSCFTKLRYINLLESNNLTKRIDEGMGLLELSPAGTSSLKEELQQLLDDTHKRAPKCPELHFTLYYSTERQSLSVHLEKIIHLPTRQPVESSDPYVSLYLLSRSEGAFATHKAIKTHSPMFDFMATFRQVDPEEMESMVLMFRAYVNHVNHFIGGVVYPLHGACFGNTIMSMMDRFPEEDSLKDGIQGDLALTLCFKPNERKMAITILEAKMRNRQNATMYVKVNLHFEDERVSKWKTSKKKSVLVFNEACELDLSQFAHDEVEIEIIVLASEHIHLRHYHQVGVVWFGFDLQGYDTGERQWRRAFDNPDKNVTAWHPIFPPLPFRLAPMGRRSPSPSRHRSPSPSRHRSPSPHRMSPSPKSRSVSPSRSQSRSPTSKFLQSCPGLGQHQM